jgi:hypothetical protein
MNELASLASGITFTDFKAQKERNILVNSISKPYT